MATSFLIQVVTRVIPRIAHPQIHWKNLSNQINKTNKRITITKRRHSSTYRRVHRGDMVIKFESDVASCPTYRTRTRLPVFVLSPKKKSKKLPNFVRRTWKFPPTWRNMLTTSYGQCSRRSPYPSELRQGLRLNTINTVILKMFFKIY